MSRILTARAVETLKPGPSRREIPDGYLPGLYFNIQPGGARSWAVRYRFGKRSRKFTIGNYPLYDLKAARQLGAQALRAVAEGKNPAAERAQSRALQPDTVGMVVAEFMKLHCSKRQNRPSTIKLYQDRFDRHILPNWKNRTIGSITRADVRFLVDAVMANGTPREANAILSQVKMLFTWALGRDIVAVSPCVALKPPAKLRPRERVLLDSELADVWRAAGQLTPQYCARVRLLMLTGQRHHEVAAMAWAELDLEAKLWRLPSERCKNNRPHEVPLSAPVLAILGGLPRWGAFVLTRDGKTYLTASAHCKAKLDTLLPSNMPPWCLHDLRRTMITGLARLGTQLPVVEQLVNHVSGSFGGVQGAYQKFGFEPEKRAALECWAAHVLKLVGNDVRL